MNRKKRTVELDDPGTDEGLRAVVETTADPTNGTVEWQLTAVGADTVSGSWSAGTWVSSSWTVTDSTTGEGQARTVSPDVVATLGAVADITYDVYVRWTVGSETPVHYAGQLRIS